MKKKKMDRSRQLFINFLLIYFYKLFYFFFLFKKNIERKRIDIQSQI